MGMLIAMTIQMKRTAPLTKPVTLISLNVRVANSAYSWNGDVIMTAIVRMAVTRKTVRFDFIF